MGEDRNKAIPTYWDRFRRSPRVRRMKDFQRYWYLALCMESHFTKRPGYLPNDMRILYQLSDCSASFKFFEMNFDCVRECFKVVTDDVRWLYNDRALEMAEGLQGKRENLRANAMQKLLEDIDTGPVFSIYKEYPRHLQRAKALKAIEKAISRLARQEKLSDVDAAERIYSAVVEFAKSPAGQKGEFTPYPATWFNQDRYLDDHAEWYRENGNGNKAEQRQQSNLAACDEAIRAIHREAGLDS